MKRNEEREYVPDTFDCEECSNINVSLDRLERSNIDQELCFCSAECRDRFDTAVREDQKRRRLIKAAPELLEAAEYAYEWIRLAEEWVPKELHVSGEGNRLLQAIRKARGEE